MLRLQYLSLGLFLISATLGSAAKTSKALPDDSIYQVESSWQDQNENTLRLKDLAGKPVIISMVYLGCKYTCPMTVKHMQTLEGLMDAKLKSETQFILVSFDSARDTPTAMKEFAKKNELGKNWRFLSAKKESDLRELSTLIDFRFKKLPDGEFEHSFGLVALDRNGRVIGSSVGASMSEEELYKKIKPILKK